MSNIFGGGFFNKGGFMNDPFFDDIEEDFKFGFGSNFMGGGFGGNRGASKSVSSSTIIKNGKKVTVTKTTTIDSNGNQHTEVHESV